MDEQQQSAAQTSSGQNDAGAKATEAMQGLEAYLAPVFEKFPHLPEGGRKFIVDIAPWIALVFGVLGVLALLGAGGIGMIAAMTTMGVALPMLIGVVISLISSAMLLMAFPGLKAHARKGWNMVFYSQVVSVIGGLVGIVIGGMYNIFGVVIGALIGFYILFEIRSYYK